jgi:succinoglycan biosynthesis protein ExoO
LGVAASPLAGSVTVIIPAYKAAAFLDRAVASALAQTVAPLEIIIVDDASPDDTLAVANALALTSPLIRVLPMPINGGPSKARNAAIAAARGDWVAVLDADDAWKPGRIAALTALGAKQNADYVADNQILYDAGSSQEVRLGFRPRWATQPLTAEGLFLNDLNEVSEFGYGILKPFVRRSFLMAHGIWYEENDRYGEDFRYSANILLEGGKGVLTSEAYYIYTTRRGELSGKMSSLSQSSPRFDLLIEASDALAAKYASKIGPSLSAAIHKRRAQLWRVHLSNQARELRRKRRYAAYGVFVLTHPPLLGWLIRQVAVRVWRRIAPATSPIPSAP